MASEGKFRRMRLTALAGMALTVSATVNCRATMKESEATQSTPTNHGGGPTENGPYGSGNFGKWTTDEGELPAYSVRLAALPTDGTRHGIRHQLGNGIVTALAHPDGPVELFTNRTFPRFANKYSDQAYAGGFGYLQINGKTISTFGQDLPDGVEASVTFGMGYLERTFVVEGLKIQQRVFTMPGEEALLDEIKFSNLGAVPVSFNYVSYWDVNWTLVPQGSDAALTRASVDQGKTVLKLKSLASQANLKKVSANKDPSPKTSFLVALTQPFESFEINQSRFFGIGGRKKPSALALNLSLSNKIPGLLVPATSSEDKVLATRYKMNIPPHGTSRLVSAYGITDAVAADAAVERIRQGYEGAWDVTIKTIADEIPRVELPEDGWLGRELAWSYYYLRSGMLREDFWKTGGLSILNQGSSYLYQAGWNAALRDPLQHIMPMFYVNPEATKDTLLYVLRNVRADGRIPYGTIGYGAETSSLIPRLNFIPSDMSLWLVWAVSEYVFATRDSAFLDLPLRGFEDTTDRTVGELVRRAYDYQVSKIAYGENGLIRILNSDWNDVLLMKSLNFDLSYKRGESTMNSAIAAAVYSKYAALMQGKDPVFAAAVRTEREKVLVGLKAQWRPANYFNRAYVSATSFNRMDEVGEEALWLEANAFAMLSKDTMTADQVDALITNMKTELVDPNQREGMNLVAADADSQFDIVSTQSAWYSINSAAIQGLLVQSDVSPQALPLAWSEFKLNTLARHAESYPHLWYGIWSGADAYVTQIGNANRAGQTWMAMTPGYQEFPVANMHGHSQPLLCSIRFAGIEVDEQGYTIVPKLLEAEFRWKSPVIAVEYAASRAEGFIKVSNVASFKLTLGVPSGLATQDSVTVTVNGQAQQLTPSHGRVSLTVTPNSARIVKWEVQ